MTAKKEATSHKNRKKLCYSCFSTLHIGMQSIANTAQKKHYSKVVALELTKTQESEI